MVNSEEDSGTSPTPSSNLPIRHVAPKWARALITPAIAGLVLFGALAILGGCRVLFVDGELRGVVVIPLGFIIVFFALRGTDLIRSRKVLAGIKDGALLYQSEINSPQVSVAITDLAIENHPTIQVVHIDAITSEKRIFTSDYFYPHGMILVEKIAEYKGEEFRR